MSPQWSKDDLNNKSRSEIVDIAKSMSIEGIFLMRKKEIVDKICEKAGTDNKDRKEKVETENKDDKEKSERQDKNGNIENENMKNRLLSKKRSDLVDIAKKMYIKGIFKMRKREIVDEICVRKKHLKEIKSDYLSNVSNETKSKILKLGIKKYVKKLEDKSSSELKNLAKKLDKKRTYEKGKDKIIKDIEKLLRGEETGKGYVYVLVSSEKPNLVKIGSTERDPEKRARELSSSTGVAMPYIVAYQAEVGHPREVERTVHSRLSESRVNPNREFFRVKTRRAIEIIEQET